MSIDNNKKMNEVIDAAISYARSYDDDDRDCIKTDVMNAFFAGTEFTAANKAAEEGGLPALPQHFGEMPTWDEMDRDTSRIGFTSDQMRAYALDAVFADRASRQVANKAEVEPLVAPDNLPRWIDDLKGKDPTIDSLIEYIIATPPATTGASTARPEWDNYNTGRAEGVAEGRSSIENHLAMLKGNRHYRERVFNQITEFDTQEGLKRFGRVGASTVLTDELKRAMFEEWATKQGGYDLSPYNWRVKSIGGVPYAGYVRPYKQDRTVHAFEGFVAALGEVAAQAGQVAVPEDSLRGTVRAMTLLLNDREWTDLPTSDADAVALWTAIEELVAENNEAYSESKHAELSGWKYVPIKATFGMIWEIMIAHRAEADEQRLAEDAWDKALAAAPSPAKESK